MTGHWLASRESTAEGYFETMANTTSAKKATRKIARRTAINRSRRTLMRGSVRIVEEAIAELMDGNVTKTMVRENFARSGAAAEGLDWVETVDARRALESRCDEELVNLVEEQVTTLRRLRDRAVLLYRSHPVLPEEENLSPYAIPWGPTMGLWPQDAWWR